MKKMLLLLAAAAMLLPAAAIPPIARAQQATEQPPMITQFQQIEDKWSTALVKQDQFTLETLLSPTFVSISFTGDVSTRNQVVAAMYEKEMPQVVSMEQRVVNVRIIEDVAIVSGTYIERTKLNGIQDEQRGIFTHIYQHVREVWVCVQSQRTALPIAEQDNGKKKKKSDKQSNASEPFHIPLLYKGAKPASQPSSQQESQP